MEAREKSSQSSRIYFGSLRDDNASAASNICRAQAFVGAKLYKNREVCLISRRRR
jgi:hypothetical protein